MKILASLAAILFLTSCVPNHPEHRVVDEFYPQNICDSIAVAHGYTAWAAVDSLSFVFVVTRPEAEAKARAWKWKPKVGQVTYTLDSTTLHSYLPTAGPLDSATRAIDAHFVNDSYWLMAPFHLVWDQSSFGYEYARGETSPIAQQIMNRLTIVYTDQGGYTPGDAYDFYFYDDKVIREWVFRKSNDPIPTLSTTWENYATVQNLLLPQSFRSSDDYLQIHFSGLE